MIRIGVRIMNGDYYEISALSAPSEEMAKEWLWSMTKHSFTKAGPGAPYPIVTIDTFVVVSK